ncbi:transmembrane protein 68-like [Galendromus occidentalis]|uniref:Transmembrane protein 68-like n=1 Tax=Galendromus occidentalis TaxID=34638 RepID=A0AAJ6QTE0_9ACAR|nr:transmembrane protein 68-like [Galendromus occidentalis]
MAKIDDRTSVLHRAIWYLVTLYWMVMMAHPFFVRFLWKYWLLRPLIIWYAPLTIHVAYCLFFFTVARVYIFISRATIGASFDGAFVKLQLLIAYYFGKLLHGMEVHGAENLPEDGGLIIAPHAPCLPIDILFFLSYSNLKLRRPAGGCADSIWHKNNFSGPTLELYGFSSEPKTLIDGLKQNRLMWVPPGGSYEAMFSRNYELEWRARIGFARVAKETGKPVIPSFTTNLQHSMPLFDFPISGFMRRWYAVSKLPLMVHKIYLPVKMCVHFGEPLHCGRNEKPEEFARRCKKAVEDLRDRLQPPQRSLLAALMQRLIQPGDARLQVRAAAIDRELRNESPSDENGSELSHLESCALDW